MPSLLRKALRPLLLAFNAFLLLILLLSLPRARKRRAVTPMASSRGRSGLEAPGGVFLPEDDSDALPGAPGEVWLDEFDPDHDEWCESLDDPEVVSSCIPYLNRCLELSSK